MNCKSLIVFQKKVSCPNGISYLFIGCYLRQCYFMFLCLPDLTFFSFEEHVLGAENE